jgi:hypothetical protein
MPIRQYIRDEVFEPETIQAMSEALERTCTALGVNGHAIVREIIATRIIHLARNGNIDAKALSDRVLSETNALREL